MSKKSTAKKKIAVANAELALAQNAEQVKILAENKKAELLNKITTETKTVKTKNYIYIGIAGALCLSGIVIYLITKGR